MGNIWKRINQGVFVVAEIGKNFIQTAEERSVKEYLKNAINLVDSAFDAGVDAVKFQTHNVKDEQLDINIKSPHFDGSDRYSWVKRNTESTPLNEFWIPLKEYCDEIGIIFFSTPMSRGAAQLLNKLDVKLWKVGSADILDIVMLDYLASTKKPIILSSGMSTLEELDKSIAFLKNKKAKIALLHCVSCYPCSIEELNLATIPLLKERYQIPIGFSDHSLKNEPSILACNCGSSIIEKHFTFSRKNWGPDHKASILPEEMKDLVYQIRFLKGKPGNLLLNMPNNELKRMIGSKEKLLQESENQFRPIFRKSLVASMDIKSGTIIKPSMIYAVRPRKFIKGLPSESYIEVVGKRVTEDVKKFEPFTLDFFKTKKGDIDEF